MEAAQEHEGTPNTRRGRSWQATVTLGLARLRFAVKDAARGAFSDLRRAYPDERFYAFALYTADSAEYISSPRPTRRRGLHEGWTNTHGATAIRRTIT